MKRIVCEMCGSTDIVKEDGVYVCQSCGTKYSVEEARKMLVEINGTVEVAGTVQTDSSHLIKNYLEMAKNALDAGNNAEADSYCNKIIEVKPSDYEAWFIKGKAVGWQSTLGNLRISETINAFSNALDNCPEEEKENLGNDCKTEIEKLHKALLTVRMQNFMNHPDQSDVNNLKQDIQSIIINTIGFLTKSGINANMFGKELGSIIVLAIINDYGKVLKEYQGDDGKPGDYQFKRFISESDCCIQGLQLATALLGTDDTDDLELYEYRALTYDAMVKFNTVVRDSCSWDYNYTDWGKSYYKNLTLTSEAIKERNKNNKQWTAEAKKWRNKKQDKEKEINAEKERKRKEEEKKRNDEYWAEHADLKASLEAEKEALQPKIYALSKEQHEQISALEKEIKGIPGQPEIDSLEERIKMLAQKKSSLGIFKGKEKVALQEQIDQANKEKSDIQKRMQGARTDLERRIEMVNEDFKNKIAPLQKKVNYINYQLTKSNKHD